MIKALNYTLLQRDQPATKKGLAGLMKSNRHGVPANRQERISRARHLKQKTVGSAEKKIRKSTATQAVLKRVVLPADSTRLRSSKHSFTTNQKPKTHNLYNMRLSGWTKLHRSLLSKDSP